VNNPQKKCHRDAHRQRPFYRAPQRRGGHGLSLGMKDFYAIKLY